MDEFLDLLEKLRFVLGNIEQSDIVALLRETQVKNDKLVAENRMLKAAAIGAWQIKEANEQQPLSMSGGYYFLFSALFNQVDLLVKNGVIVPLKEKE